MITRGRGPQAEQEPETFPREYVKHPRQENGRYRQRADVYAHRLNTELVRTGLPWGD